MRRRGAWTSARFQYAIPQIAVPNLFALVSEDANRRLECHGFKRFASSLPNRLPWHWSTAIERAIKPNSARKGELPRVAGNVKNHSHSIPTRLGDQSRITF